jgi:mono/diheme cytochrome c family protein
MRTQKTFSNIAAGIAAFLIITNLGIALPPSSQQPHGKDLRPTAIAGESWLKHLVRSFDETSMGKTGRLGPLEADDSDGSVPPELTRQPEKPMVVLHGSDLYRMNCRGCHGEDGTGAPPEINSVINPVRATSAAVILERVKQTGAAMSRADAEELAGQSRSMLLDRLHHGGQDMPSFPHLSEAEVNSLIAYLRLLAGVHGAEAEQLAVQEQSVRVGEHIAKSTCHICHSAAGANPTAQELYMGAIPPLSTLVLRTNQAQFVRKVTRGAPILMGTPPQFMRGRMPVFYYLSEEEAADIYSYLRSYPPYEYAVLDAATVSSAPASSADTNELTPRPEPASTMLPASPARQPASEQSEPVLADGQVVILAVLLGLMASMVLLLGFWFSVRELRRLSGHSQSAPQKGTASATAQFDPELAA